VLGVGWTLNLEMVFYLLFSGALMLTRRFAPLLFAGVLIVFMVFSADGQAGDGPWGLYVTCSGYLAFFVLGIAIYYVWRLIPGRVAVAMRAYLIAGSVIAAPLFVAANLGFPVQVTYAFALLRVSPCGPHSSAAAFRRRQMCMAIPLGIG
jgi:exopolysaccharide production protein ExoZ